jgi:hypothetical protein
MPICATLTREVDCANGVGVVVDIGWMAAATTSVRPSPCRAGAIQAHTQPVAVVMNLVGSAVEHLQYIKYSLDFIATGLVIAQGGTQSVKHMLTSMASSLK